MENIKQNVSRGAEDKLFNNLPVAYHDALHDAIARVRALLQESSGTL